MTVGMYDDGTPGELFVTMAKEGSVVSGLMDNFATMISMALQYGVPLRVLSDKFSHTRFEPSGFTGNPEIPYAKSITDYIFRWLAVKFMTPEQRRAAGVVPEATATPASPDTPHMKDNGRASVPSTLHATSDTAPRVFDDAPPCSVCGSIMVRNGSCYKCLNCGTTSGCS
jgi:ribonucleoside-diphosphate reductase alpha chain